MNATELIAKQFPNRIMKKRKSKVADEHQTGVWIWKGKRVTEGQWKKLRAKENVFYCEPCRIEKGWPESLDTVSAKCGQCGKVAICYDLPAAKVADEHTGVRIWKGRRITERQWNAIKAKVAKSASVLPPGIAESSLDNQLSWALEQLKALANILKLPADKTFKDLVPHAKKMMAELEELRKSKRRTTRKALDGYARLAEPI